MIRRFAPWSPVLLWAALLFYLSSRTWDGVGGSFPIGDFGIHLVLYAVLGGALALGRRLSPDPPSSWLLLTLGLLYGLSDEVHQGFVPGRTPDPMDLLADAAGLVLGYGGFHLLAGGASSRSDS